MADRWSSLWDGCRQPPRAPYPRLGRPGPGLVAYLPLLRLGVTVPRLLPGARWALTPPFPPYPLDKRAVCFLWPVPSPCGAQALPGSLPSGARTFLSAPLRPAHRDHHALQPPRGKVSVPEGSGQASARQPSQQAHQAVGRESSGSLRPPRFSEEPEAVVFLEHEAFQTRPIAGPQQRRRELDGVHAVQPARPQQPEHVTRLGLRREQEERPVGQGEALEQAEREPIRRRLGKAEREVNVAPLAENAVPERTGPLRDFVLEGPIVERQQACFSQGPGSASPRGPREESAGGSRAPP